MAIGIEVVQTGELFERPKKITDQVFAKFIQRLVELGEQRLDETLRPRPNGVYLSTAEAQKGRASTGNYRRNVHSVIKGLNAKITDGGVIYGPWLEGTGSRNETTQFKGYASFRKTEVWLNEQAKTEAQKFTNEYVKRLNA